MAKTPTKVMNTKQLATLKSEDVFNGANISIDGVQFNKFSKVKDDPNPDWNCKFVHIKDTQKFEHNNDLDQDRWLVMVFERDKIDKKSGDLVYYQAFIGNILLFVQNHMKANCEGIVVKKCKLGFDLLLHSLRNTPAGNVLANVKADHQRYEANTK